MYKPIDSADIDFIKTIIPPERLFIGEDISEDYSHDELGSIRHMPEVLVEPISVDEISNIVRYVNKKRIPIVARGMGTGLVGAAIATHGGILMSMQKMNRILELDEENMTLTVEPGVLLKEVTDFVQAKGLFYPPDPGEKSATIGGNISTNAGGMRAVKYGVTRDYVRGLEVVLPSGDVVSFGGKVVKNSSGYDLKDLIVGGEGTLGIITKATLKLLPLPQYSLSILVPFDNILDAISAVTALLRLSYTPTAVEFMEKDLIDDCEVYLGRPFPDKSSDAYLLLTYDGNSMQEVQACLQPVADVLFARGGKDLLMIDTEDRKELVWPTRAAFLEVIKGLTPEWDECDVVVPKSKVAALFAYANAAREKHNIRIKIFGHAGDGNLHIDIMRDDLSEEEWQEKLAAVFEDLYAKAAEFEGKVSGEHGIGLVKIGYFMQSEQPAVLDLMRGIKKLFDPNMIMNPGKIVL